MQAAGTLSDVRVESRDSSNRGVQSGSSQRPRDNGHENDNENDHENGHENDLRLSFQSFQAINLIFRGDKNNAMRRSP